MEERQTTTMARKKRRDADDVLISLEEAARRIHASKRWTLKNGPPFFKIAGKWYATEAALEEWLRERTTESNRKATRNGKEEA